MWKGRHLNEEHTRMVATRKRILLVDPDPAVTLELSNALSAAGYHVLSSWDRTGIAQTIRTGDIDLVLLDPTSPGLRGLALCRTIRRTTCIPVIIVSHKTAESDRVAGLKAGADDYVTKPFSQTELSLRIKAVLRRAEDRGSSSVEEAFVLADHDLVVDVVARTAFLSGRRLPLTVREFALLEFLMSFPGTTFSRRELLLHVWGWAFGSDTTVTVHVRRLRVKLETDPAAPIRILTERGLGYRYARQPRRSVPSSSVSRRGS
jgi:DNA-binding response OmpR family regulator